MTEPAAPWWHVREAPTLEPGSRIERGRWGRLLAETGEKHRLMSRELAFEAVRLQMRCPISRWDCSYVFDDLATASRYLKGSDKTEVLYEVGPASAYAASVRVDMLYLTWWAEPGRSDEQKLVWAVDYWRGRSASDAWAAEHPGSEANQQWELLVASDLIVVGVVEVFAP